MAVQNVNVDASPSPSLPLPTGASTEATLALIKAKTDNLDVALSTRTKPADTQAVSAASLPLPAGASTAAKQPALGVAGTPSVDVISIQGVSNGTPVPVSGNLTTTPSFGTRSDTFTAAGNGVTVNVTTAPLKAFAIQVKGTGAIATSWTVVLEGSLDGTNFTTVLTDTLSTGDGTVLYSGATLYPSLYFRARCVAIVLGTATNLVVTILG